MAGRKENLKALFTNTRTRVIIIFTGFLLLLAILVGAIKLHARLTAGPTSTAALGTGPMGIRSVPGALDPTVQYARLQEAQNQSQASEAMKTGGSAIPTIIRAQKLGQGVGGIQGNRSGGVGFTTLSEEGNLGPQKNLWFQTLQDGHCSPSSIIQVRQQGATLQDLKSVCTCAQLNAAKYSLPDLLNVCSCPELRGIGFTAMQFKQINFSLPILRSCGFSACEMKGAGYNANQMKAAGFSNGELKGAGFSDAAIEAASGLPAGIKPQDIWRAGCQVDALKRLRAAGVSAATIRRYNGCSAAQLRAAGYSAADLKNAGFTPAELAAAGFSPAEISAAGLSSQNCSVSSLQAARAQGVTAKTLRETLGCSLAALKAAGFTPAELAAAGFTPAELAAAGFTPAELAAAGLSLPSTANSPLDLPKNCNVDSLQTARARGISAKTIRETLGCTLAQLKAAGFTPTELAAAGFTPAELAAAGFGATQNAVGTTNCSVTSLRAARAQGVTAKTIRETLGCSLAALKAAGYTPAELRDAGFTAAELRAAGFSPADLKAAGFTAQDLHDAGFSPSDLKRAGFDPDELRDLGYSDSALQQAGIAVPSSRVAGLQSLAPPSGLTSTLSALPQQPPARTLTPAELNAQRLNEIANRQSVLMASQQYQQQVQQRMGQMMGTAAKYIQGWQIVSAQTYVAGNADTDKKGVEQGSSAGIQTINSLESTSLSNPALSQKAIIKSGDVMFAVIDTSVNSDEPGPILATLVTGKFKGSKLIGSFNLANNAEKLVLNFTTMSVPGAPKTTGINAYAIDPNTARTALSSYTDHHYLLRYGSLFASSFLQGFGNAFQSANTTITIGGIGGSNNFTVSNGVGRSALENAVIGLATVGQNWGQFAQQQFNRPVTVEICSGTNVGILFTQDLMSL